MDFVPSELKRTVRLPIKIKEGHVVADYNGPLPRLEEGTTGDLIVPAHAVLEPGFVARLHQEQERVLLGAGQILRFGIHIKDVPAPLLPYVHPSDGFRTRGIIGYVEVILQEALTIRLRGTKRAELGFARCTIPALENRAAISLNQAYTFISEAFEPKRQSHTGNVFQGGQYCIASGWRSLEALREDLEEEDLRSRFQVAVTDVKDHPLPIVSATPSPLTWKLPAVSEPASDFDISSNLLPRLRALYPHWMRTELTEVRILQRQGTVWLETAIRDRSGREETVQRIDLGFIEEDDALFFPSVNTAQENAERFLYDFDPYSIIQCTDLFTPDAAVEVARLYEDQEQPHLPFL